MTTIIRNMTTIIRKATAADVGTLVDMGRRFHASSHYSQLLKANPVSMASTAMSMLGDPTSANSIVLVAEVDGQVVGMLGLAAYTHPLSGERMAAEIFWWVDENYRNGVGLKLLKFGQKWAKDIHAVRLQMIAPNAEVATLYSRLGFTWVESNYQKEL